jgi:carbamoyl-phosphate synthase large subunit
VLEVNPRASRTVPYLSKVTGVPMVALATKCMMGKTLHEMGYESGLWALGCVPSRQEGGEAACALPMVADEMGLGRDPAPTAKGYIIPEAAFREGPCPLPKPSLFAIKAPVFSFQKLAKVEPSLGPEMKSTGEILGIDKTFEGALYKALVASGINFKGGGYVLITVRDEDKEQAVEIGKQLKASGRSIACTPGTAASLLEAGIECETVNKIQMGSPNIMELIMDGKVSLMINTPSLDESSESEAARIRRACIETGVPCVTSIDTAAALIRALDVFANPETALCLRLEEYFPA